MATKKTTPGAKKPAKESSKAGKSRAKKPGTFKPNDPTTGYKDPRINRTGQNAKFTEFHRMISRVFSEGVQVNKKKMDRLEKMIREWVDSGEAPKQVKALEYLVGKVPDELNVHSDVESLIRLNLHLLTDGQLERLKGGEKPAEIIAELLEELRSLKDVP